MIPTLPVLMALLGCAAWAAAVRLIRLEHHLPGLVLAAAGGLLVLLGLAGLLAHLGFPGFLLEPVAPEVFPAPRFDLLPAALAAPQSGWVAGPT